MRAVWLTLGSVLLVAAACGGDAKDPITGPNGTGNGGASSGAGGRGGTGQGGGAGDAGAGGVPDDTDVPGAPDVRITSPEPLASPGGGAVLQENQLEVSCEVTQSSDAGSLPVSASTVLIQMLDAAGDLLSEAAGVEATPDVFTTTFVLTAVPNGRVSFRCSAADTSNPPLIGSDTVDTFVDHGPTIEVVSPLEDSAHPLLGAVAFEFLVTAEPLVRGDGGAEISRVTLDVGGVRIPTDENEPGQYLASVNLADPLLFPDPPVGTVPVVIRATNSRVPEAVVRTKSYNFVLDDDGPVITITEPTNSRVVGGEVVLRFTVVDALSMVDADTVSVKINQLEAEFFDPNGPWTQTGNIFTFSVDTTRFATSVAQATININARDLAGNPSEGESLVLNLDNVPPYVDLDPPLIREGRADGAAFNCSVGFDPVGPAAANQGQRVFARHTFRALVWERTNAAPVVPGSPSLTLYHAGTDAESVYLYVQPDRNTPLLVNNDADAACDDLAISKLEFLHLDPVPPQGSSWFGSETPGLSLCEYLDEEVPPPNLCPLRTSDMARVISGDNEHRTPVVYGNAVREASADCTGTHWEFGTTFPEGWICFAALAKDSVGNLGISRPLQLCLDDNVGTPPDCSSPPPPCTDGCSLPPAFPPNRVIVLQ